jgi:ParB family chromosome partitioning protein
MPKEPTPPTLDPTPKPSSESAEEPQLKVYGKEQGNCEAPAGGVVSRKISEIKTLFTFRQDLGDISGLAESIRRLGLLRPITVTRDNYLVCGRRCLEACKLLGWDSVPVTIWEGPPHG